MDISKYHKVIRWVILSALTAGFLYEGVIKLLGMETAQFVAWGFPAWSVYVIGGIECFGALGLFYRPLVKLSLFLLTALIIGAVLTLAGKHLFFPRMIAPILFMLGLFGLMYLKAKRPEEEEGRWGLL